MLTKAIGFAATALFAPAIFGQNPPAGATPAAAGDLVRVFYLPHAATVQDFQEAVNAAHTITEIRRMFSYTGGNAVIVRGTSDQIAMAEWMLHELDQANAQTPAESAGSAHEYKIGSEDVIRLFFLPNAKTVQDLQEIANAVRTTTEIRRVFAYNATRAIAIRGTPGELAMAEWLLAALDKPAGSPQTQAQQIQASNEYRAPGAADDVMRVFYLTNTKSVQDFQEIAVAIRNATEIRRVSTYNVPRALVVRGTADQMALSATLIRDLSR